MKINQDTLLKQIADKEGLNIAAVRSIFRSAEELIWDYLTASGPAEDVALKLFHGISIHRTYVGEKKYSKGMFQNISCPEHVNVKAHISKYYHTQVNQALFDSQE